MYYDFRLGRTLLHPTRAGGALPAFVSLSASSILESAAIGDTIGTFSVANGTGTYTFSLTDSAGGVTSLTGAALKVAAALNYEVTTSYNISVTADNGVDPPILASFTIFILDVDEVAPTITSSAAISVGEGLQLAHALTASESVSWSIVGGADQSDFELSGTTLRWFGSGSKDFEVPDDADLNNVYEVTIRATDLAGLTTNQNLAVTVTDVADTDLTGPTITSASSVSVQETLVLSHDLTASEDVTWSIVGGADQGDFEIFGSTLRWNNNGAQNFESPADANANNIYIVVVRATDLAANTTDQTISVTVTDVEESPSVGWPFLQFFPFL